LSGELDPDCAAEDKSLVAVYMVRAEVGVERNSYKNVFDAVVIKVSDTSY